MPDLYACLGELLRSVPAGRVTTYGDLAEALGNVAAARWIATYLLAPGAPADLSPHRVVLRDGSLGRYCTGDAGEKARLLRAEGVEVQQGTVDLERYRAKLPVCPRPLARLAAVQTKLLGRLRLEAPPRLPQTVAGVDVSYVTARETSPDEAVAAYALVDVATGQLVWSLTVKQTVRFPYIPGYLSFRELPLYFELFRRAQQEGRLAEVVFVDGNGILHPRRAGIATHLGIAADRPTIGIGKSLLCGRVDLEGMRPGEPRPVEHEGETIGVALRGAPGAKAIYISPGNRVDVPFAARLTQLLLRGRRVPEPIHYAHTISRKAARVAHGEVPGEAGSA